MLRRKIFTCNIKEIENRKGKYCLYGKEIGAVELMGVCIDHGEKFIRILDFYSEIVLYKSPQTSIPSHRCIFRCKIFIKDNKLALYCINVKRADLYEELFFIVEANKLNEVEKITYNEKKCVKSDI
ncbi:hypothetical protein NGRA_2171 [Nosema granulosis]|uniref:Uncharacterized protein n=1 Tax=Nosema granulosis TaxID=83296 RepID=A0A9P6GYM6_9MICR|nr:hypothetical protein NGRA_2171 [Nosema granulosis]